VAQPFRTLPWIAVTATDLQYVLGQTERREGHSMKSPRFPMREPHLRAVAAAGHLADLWKRKVRDAMRKQNIQDPIEHLDFHVNLTIECKKLEDLILSGSYVTGRIRRILVEKSKGLCRQIVIPNVHDALILQSLSDALWADIKGKAPSKNAFYLPDDHAFSKRSDPHSEPGYGSFRAWLDFQRAIFGFAATRNYIVVTDIANYYDCISYGHLRNIISDLVPVKEEILDMLIFVLSGLLWQPDYMPRVDIGLPQIDLDAPRVLAHCFLFELDKAVTQHFNFDYVRYMDDIDIGVDSISEAKRILRSVDLILQTRQVRLNSGKTKILSHLEAIKHFRVRENERLDKFVFRIERRRKNNQCLEREKRLLPIFVTRRYFAREFDDGNGEKILKRLITMCRNLEVPLEVALVEDILLKRPNLRRPILRLVSIFPIKIDILSMIKRIVESKQLVDEIALINISYTLVESNVIKNQTTQKMIVNIARSLDVEQFCGLYAAILIYSKFGSLKELIELIRRQRPVWFSDEWLGRLVGALSPLFDRSVYGVSFRALIHESRNPGAIAAREFHSDIRVDGKFYGKISGFLRATNDSKPLRITHGKFLMLLSVLSTPNVVDKQKLNLIRIHSEALSDPFYRSLARRSIVPKRIWPVKTTPSAASHKVA
jgi:hypothetical protein